MSPTTNKPTSDSQQTKDTTSTKENKQESTTAPPSISSSAYDASKNPEDLLKEYSKELYVYTLDLLNSVRIDSAHKGANGKAFVLKRTISDIAVPLKTMGIASDASKGSKGTAAPA